MIIPESSWFIGMEESARVREAMRSRGIPAVSCDYLDSALPGPHIKGDVFKALKVGMKMWLGGIFFPTCTYVCSSGLHWNKRVAGRQALTDAAVEELWTEEARNRKSNWLSLDDVYEADADHTALDVWPPRKQSDLSLAARSSAAEAYQNPLSLPACGYWANQTPSGQNKLGPSPDRAKMRSRTYPGIAAAMAEQWGVASLMEGLI